MPNNTSSILFKALRAELASAIADFKAYDVPSICKRIGLSEGSEEEAFQSKQKYAQKRIANLTIDDLLKSARLLYSEEGGYALGEALAKVDDLQFRPITKLTRRRVIKLFEGQPLVTEVDEIDFICSVWPISDMPAANGIHYDNLEAFLVQHTVRNDDLTQQELMESLGLLESSTSQFFKFLEAVTSAEYQSVKRQSDLAEEIDRLLRHDGYRRLRASDASISLATVYRNLASLKKVGVAERHYFEGHGARYESTISEHHDHIVDLESDEVIEFQSEEIEKLQQEVARKLGYEVVHHRLELYCQKL
ncbi:MAG: AbiJ-related protein [Rhodobacterales bacterium]